MEVILTKVSKLGNVGDTVTVKGGYARNHLLPTGAAVSTTPENITYFDSIRSDLEAQAAEELKQARSLAAELSKIALRVPAKVSEGTTIFGSVGVIDILQHIQKSHPQIERRQVQLIGGAAKELGEYEVTIQCHRDVVVPLTLTIVDIADE